MAIQARAYSPTEGEILIYDVIATDVLAGTMEHISAGAFDAALKALGPIRTLNIRVNSPGGSTAEAAAIIQQLKRFKANGGRVVVRVDGYAVSAASWIAMHGDEIVIAEDAFIMIYEPAADGSRRAQEMRVAAEMLDKLTASMAADYATRSGQSVERVRAMMRDETWMGADDAVRLGFADRVEQPMRIAALSPLQAFEYRRTPVDLVVPKLGITSADVWARWNRPYQARKGGR